jgi:hypothetical protein
MKYYFIVVAVRSSQFCMKRPDLLSGLSLFISRFNLLMVNHPEPVRAALPRGQSHPETRQRHLTMASLAAGFGAELFHLLLQFPQAMDHVR